MSFKLINTCVFFGTTSLFCSSLYQEAWAQAFKIVFIHFMGNVAKMCANFSYLIFSLNRLLLIVRQEKEAIAKSRKKLIFIYILFLILISSILNSFKLFQYKPNSDLDERKEFPFEIRDEFYCSINQIPSFECQLFNVFKLANRLLNDVLFMVLNVCIDLILLKKTKTHLNRKLKQINDLSHHKKIEKRKKNLNRMIFFNSFNYILSHLPEFVVTLLLIVYARRIAKFCNNKFSCDLLNEEAEVFSLISMVFQFYMFKMFDRNFKSSCEDLKKKVFMFMFGKKKVTSSISSSRQTNLELSNLKQLIGNGIID